MWANKYQCLFFFLKLANGQMLTVYSFCKNPYFLIMPKKCEALKMCCYNMRSGKAFSLSVMMGVGANIGLYFVMV